MLSPLRLVAHGPGVPTPNEKSSKGEPDDEKATYDCSSCIIASGLGGTDKTRQIDE